MGGGDSMAFLVIGGEDYSAVFVIGVAIFILIVISVICMIGMNTPKYKAYEAEQEAMKYRGESDSDYAGRTSDSG